ncbi:LmbE family protein [Acidimicrobium ferrooxidans DSM 10331]|uniref:LmbE family protein n=1 Tax=Acidimicrobium ferrooxidans (strain DSM 10331 / JCM 15462 / NBRC 103882 / ICP) TaxID=525909 RepID=C7M0M3_ACIFD|nr:PIG-L family deacetylase [Acidimicrobium ferrooxidans]ACU54531.1 LmbE family protein [Acidimicrobium ferrooxidans DSM 10331]
MSSQTSARQIATFRLVTVHAHPDDEASKGAATIARYADAGVHCVLVTATGGEEGSYLNPQLATERPERMARMRREELDKAAAIAGYAEIVRLGFRDSGMPGSPTARHPRAFGSVPLLEAARGLIATFRRVRPHVVISYPEDQAGYPHPDHLRVFEATRLALALAPEPTVLPELGPPWRVPRWAWSLWVRERSVRIAEALRARGIEVPWARTDRPGQDELVGARVDVTGFIERAHEALRAHASQVDPASPWWFALGASELEELWPTDDYHIVGQPAGVVVDDLFADLLLEPASLETRW